MKPQEDLDSLNVINIVDDPSGHDMQFKLTLNNQAQLLYFLVKTVSGVIQCVVALSEK